jgi:tRNA (mo5U34)-methyltransferase
MEKLIVWGTGGACDDFLEYLDYSRYKIVAFCESHENIPPKVHRGAPVISPSGINKLDWDYIVVASTFYKSILDIVDTLGIDESKVYCVISKPMSALLKFSRKDNIHPAITEDVASTLDRYWYHKIEFFPGFCSLGYVPLRRELVDYPNLFEFTGKKVLDIGAFDGVYTFEAERRGGLVTAYDVQHPDKVGFNAAKRVLASSAHHIIGSVDDLNPMEHGIYDIVMYFGVFYHLFNPLLGFFNINKVLADGGILLFEGQVLDYAYNTDPWAKSQEKILNEMRNIPVSVYVKGMWGYREDSHTWFVPNSICLKQWIETAGFEIIKYNVSESDSRGYGLAMKRHSLPIEHPVLGYTETIIT